MFFFCFFSLVDRYRQIGTSPLVISCYSFFFVYTKVTLGWLMVGQCARNTLHRRMQSLYIFLFDTNLTVNMYALGTHHNSLYITSSFFLVGLFLSNVSICLPLPVCSSCFLLFLITSQLVPVTITYSVHTAVFPIQPLLFNNNNNNNPVVFVPCCFLAVVVCYLPSSVSPLNYFDC